MPADLPLRRPQRRFLELVIPVREVLADSNFGESNPDAVQLRYTCSTSPVLQFRRKGHWNPPWLTFRCHNLGTQVDISQRCLCCRQGTQFWLGQHRGVSGSTSYLSDLKTLPFSSSYLLLPSLFCHCPVWTPATSLHGKTSDCPRENIVFIYVLQEEIDFPSSYAFTLLQVYAVDKFPPQLFLSTSIHQCSMPAILIQAQPLFCCCIRTRISPSKDHA
jgi:hypothetical protein